MIACLAHYHRAAVDFLLLHHLQRGSLTILRSMWVAVQLAGPPRPHQVRRSSHAQSPCKQKHAKAIESLSKQASPPSVLQRARGLLFLHPKRPRPWARNGALFSCFSQASPFGLECGNFWSASVAAAASGQNAHGCVDSPPRDMFLCFESGLSTFQPTILIY